MATPPQDSDSVSEAPPGATLVMHVEAKLVAGDYTPGSQPPDPSRTVVTVPVSVPPEQSLENGDAVPVEAKLSIPPVFLGEESELPVALSARVVEPKPLLDDIDMLTAPSADVILVTTGSFSPLSIDDLGSGSQPPASGGSLQARLRSRDHSTSPSRIAPRRASQMALPIPGLPSQDDFPYTIITQLGVSAECVWHAAIENHEGRERNVVIKRMLPEAASVSSRRERFVKEAEVALGLSHPHLVKCHAVGELNGLPYLVRELVDGVNLRTIAAMGSGAGLSIPAALDFASQVANALAYIHRFEGPNGEPLGLIHGEVSPSSILVNRDGVARLTEPTISRLDDRALRPSTGARGGHFGYRAPEQRIDWDVGPEVDVFALGLVLAEVISGLPLIVEGTLGLDDLEELVRARCGMRGQVPDALVELLVEMTALEPDKRPADGPAVAERIGHLRADLPPSPGLEFEIAAAFDRQELTTLRPSRRPSRRAESEPGQMPMPWEVEHAIQREPTMDMVEPTPKSVSPPAAHVPPQVAGPVSSLQAELQEVMDEPEALPVPPLADPPATDNPPPPPQAIAPRVAPRATSAVALAEPISQSSIDAPSTIPVSMPPRPRVLPMNTILALMVLGAIVAWAMLQATFGGQ